MSSSSSAEIKGRILKVIVSRADRMNVEQYHIPWATKDDREHNIKKTVLSLNTRPGFKIPKECELYVIPRAPHGANWVAWYCDYSGPSGPRSHGAVENVYMSLVLGRTGEFYGTWVIAREKQYEDEEDEGESWINKDYMIDLPVTNWNAWAASRCEMLPLLQGNEKKKKKNKKNKNKKKKKKCKINTLDVHPITSSEVKEIVLK